MDGDGEDRPEEIKSLLKEIQNTQHISCGKKEKDLRVLFSIFI